MKIIEVPIINEDGSIECKQLLTAKEAQHLLQFALNFLAATGMSVQMIVAADTEAKEATDIIAEPPNSIN